MLGQAGDIKAIKRAIHTFFALISNFHLLLPDNVLITQRSSPGTKSQHNDNKQHMSSLKVCLAPTQSNNVLNFRGQWSNLQSQQLHTSFKILLPSILSAENQLKCTIINPNESATSHRNDTKHLLFSWMRPLCCNAASEQTLDTEQISMHISSQLFSNDEVERQEGLQGRWHHPVLCNVDVILYLSLS